MKLFAYEQWYEHCRRRKGKRWLSKSGKYVNAYLPLKMQLIQFRNWKYNLNSYRDDRTPIDFKAERLMNIGKGTNYEPSVSWSMNEITGVLFNRQNMVIAIVENNRWKYLPKPISYDIYDLSLDVKDVLKAEIKICEKELENDSSSIVKEYFKDNAKIISYAFSRLLEMPFVDFIELISSSSDLIMAIRNGENVKNNLKKLSNAFPIL